MNVPVAVILDRVTSSHDLAGEVRVAFHQLTNTEESRFRLVFIQERQHPGRDVRVRSVVDCYRHGAAGGGVVRQPGPIRPEKRASRPQPSAGEHQMIDKYSPQRPRPKVRSHHGRGDRGQVQGCRAADERRGSPGSVHYGVRHGFHYVVARVRGKPRIEEISPELPPHRPFVPPGHDVDAFGGESRRHHPVAVGETIVSPEAQVQRRWPGPVLLDEAPYPTLIVVFR